MKLSDVGYKIPNYETNTYEEIPSVFPQAQVEAFYHNENVMENPARLQDMPEYINEMSRQKGTFKQW